ncbi:restriction endonuclease subunit S [Lysinibacillus sp. NPDC093197]|uniref:restriction endonuclease subunit S n=1 Tax=Lysinibacillus sp. NPDC093197 TaxID=3364132 RepID=UPI00381888DD
MKLEQIAEFTQGAFATRLETTEKNIPTVEVKPLSLKEFNETLGVSYRISNEKKLAIRIPKEKLDARLLTDTQSLVLHTQAEKVVLLPEKYSGLLLTNNFLKIKLHDSVDLAFFEWYFNEHPAIQKQLSVLSEGSSVSMLKLLRLKDLNVELPDLEKQKVIGRIAQLKKQKEALQLERIELQRQFILGQLMKSMENN